MGFLGQVTGKKMQLIGDDSWWRVAEESMLQAERTKTINNYIDKRQSTVAGWVALRPILNVCAKETGYEGRERILEPW